MKKHIGTLILLLIPYFLPAQTPTTQLHIHYTPSIADLYNRSNDETSPESAVPLQLATQENYFDYQKIDVGTLRPVTKNTISADYSFYLDVIQPHVYYLLSTQQNPLLENLPVRLLWLGKGQHTLDIYSVIENIETLEDRNTIQQYRMYYEGEFANENRFLEQYAQALHQHQQEYQRIFTELYSSNSLYDSSDAYRNEIADKLTQRQSVYFDRVDSTLQSLNASYKRLFPKPSLAFEAFIKPELQFLGYAYKLSYLINLLSAQSVLKVSSVSYTPLIQKATKLIAELDKQPQQLQSSSYRNSYFTSIFLKNWAHSTDKAPSTLADWQFIQDIEAIIDHDFKDRPVLSEYLWADLASYYLQYLPGEDTKIATQVLSQFRKRYPKSAYVPVLNKKLQKKEAEFQAKKEEEKQYDYNPVDTAVDVVDSVMVTDDAAAMDEEKVQAGFWNYTLYDAKNNRIKIKDLKGKNLAIRALSSDNVSSRDLVYFQFLEKKFKRVQFLYVVFGSPTAENSRYIQSFKLKGKFLYVDSPPTDAVPELTEEELNAAPPPPQTTLIDESWDRWLYEPYWHFIDSQGFMQRTYQSDNLEAEFMRWLKK